MIYHSSQFQGLCSTKISSENLPYFIHTKTQSCLSSCQHKPGHSLGINKVVAQNEKTEKATLGFHIPIHI